MKKRKVYEISVIDKTYSKTISDETKFYTSDTALELVFKLKETEYIFESAEIVLLNIDDHSLLTRPVAKSLSSFTYELEDDITAHYGEWRGQLRFEQSGETYVSSPVKFRIENDLSNDRPPQLSDVQSWVSLKRYADKLTDELKQAVLEVEGMDDTFKANELARQSTFEVNESERNQTFESNELTRQTQELEREKAEVNRQTTFENNETNRTETFNANETTRQTNETTREQAEQERQSAEIIRVENENQRNLTSVDEFIKLQKAVGGRNLIKNSEKIVSSVGKYTFPIYGINSNELIEDKEYTISFDIRSETATRINQLILNESIYLMPNYPIKQDWTKLSATFKYKNRDHYGYDLYPHIYPRDDFSGVTEVRYLKLEEGTEPTPWTPAPEDYTVVSKDDYYNHIKFMNDVKNNQFNQLKQAVIALGGTI